MNKGALITKSSGASLLAVYRRCADAVYRMALSITRDRLAAEDVVQEAFCRVQARLEQLADPDACDGYVYRTARNLALDHIRKRNPATPLDADRVALVDDPGDGLRSREEAAQLSQALLELPDEQREVVLLKVYDEQTLRGSPRSVARRWAPCSRATATGCSDCANGWRR